MRLGKRLSAIIILLAAALPIARASEASGFDPVRLRQILLETNKGLEWNPEDGYAAEGRFILKATGEELVYRARYARVSGRWAADFSHENRSRNVRYAFSGGRAWIASPEITMDMHPICLPYMARFDYFVLYDELLRILKKGKQDPRFAMDTAGNNIHVRGNLPNNWEAVYIISAANYMPRKVRINMVKEPSDSWLFAFSNPDGTGHVSGPSVRATDFEIWFSDPVETDDYRYALRTDFVENGIVVGTCLLEKLASFQEENDLFVRPLRFPWAEKADFIPRTQWPVSSIYMNAVEQAALRNRIGEEPWKGWNKTSGLIAFWANVALWIAPIVPGALLFKTVAVTVLIGFLVFVFLLVRRRNRLKRKFSWKLFAVVVFTGCLILAAEIASLHLRSPVDRSLFALHAALRYSATGDSSYAEIAQDLMEGLAQASARSMEELGRCSQAYALSYDIIRPEVSQPERGAIEKTLFDHAAPLYGASLGWISNLNDGSAIAAGLGMTGLAIGHEPFIVSADEAIRRTLETQLTEGLHRAGPGQGCMVMDSAVNLFYGLKQAKRRDYYAHPSLRAYIQSALHMISPVGTLPLFGDTDLDQPANLSMLFLKTANRLPPEEEGQCIAAYQRYWEYNTHTAGGFKRWILPALRPAKVYYGNPYAMIQYAKSSEPVALPASSTVLGDGQTAILRTGGAADDLYLALNAPKANPENSRRDILTFDFHAYRALLLNGAGFPGENHPQSTETKRTAAGNSITMNNESQTGTKSSGIEMSLLNQHVFDYVRASADKTYDHGKVEREVVMVRPEQDRPGYYLLIDTIDVGDSATTIQWHLHGSGDLASGVGQQARWTAAPFSPSRRRSGRVHLEVSFPTGFMGYQTTNSGILFSGTPSLNRTTTGITIEWIGSRRFVTSLFPYVSGNSATIEALGIRSGRIGDTDWVSTGNHNLQVTAGPLAHISELTVFRNRGAYFPALLLISGIEFRFGPYSLTATKPLTASLDGLRGVWINSRPDTVVEIHSPEIMPGDKFFLDGRMIAAVKSGRLTLQLQDPGEHRLQRTP